jgi:hypothetical protein
MPHAGKAVGDAGALLGYLLEDSGSAVPRDFVIRFHGPRVDSLHRASSEGYGGVYAVE